ncbi:MAG TPA: dienelactone hydrolase family protein [Roseiarcus sp.]|nr:dienelactone hydrolase family protein [Roseiarcus sp.]
MSETRKLAAILVADIVGYSRLTGVDEELTLARLRTLRSDLIDPTIAVHQGRIVKRTGDGAIVEFRSVVEAVRCAMEVRSGLAERNAGLPAEKRIEARVGIHLGDVVEESDGDLMGDGVNVAARLEGICEPGCVCLSAAAYEQVRDKLHVTFVDMGEQSLKNIARPMRAYMLRVAEGGAASQAATLAARARRSVWRWATIAAAFLAVLIAAGWFGPRVFAPWRSPASLPAAVEDKLASEPRLSIVVLPFANLSGDPEQDYFADGLTDDLTTDLSHLPGSFVIAHNTAMIYKGKPADVKEIGRDFGVRYALEGSVRRVGETITINAQLISTETGAHVWADRFEGDRGKLGELQVEAVARIANALGVQLVQAESLRAMRERPNNPDAVDLVMRGSAAMNKVSGPESLNRAIGFFDQALRLDPDSPQALTGKAVAQLYRLYAFGIGDRKVVIDDAKQAADRVLASQPNNAGALFVKAMVFAGTGQYDATLANLDAAIGSDRNFALAYAEISNTLLMLGRAEEAIKPAEQALRLNPHDSSQNTAGWYYLCNAYAHLAQWEKAIGWCEKSAASNPSNFWPYFDLAAANGWLGRPSEASAAVAELHKLKPGFTVQDYLALPHPDNAKWKSEDQRIVEGLRKAGLPERLIDGRFTNVIAIPVVDADTEAIRGELFKPQGAGPFPAVIYLGFCRSFYDEGEGVVEKILLERLPTKGFATLILDPYMARRQPNGVCEELDSKADWYARRLAEDAYAALNVLAKLPDIDPKRVFLLGYGLGANSALLATDSRGAANRPVTFAGVVSYWPYCGYGTDFPVPTLVVKGEKDDWSPASLCTDIKGRPNLEVVVYPGVTSAFPLPGARDFMGRHEVYDEKATQDAQARTEAFLAAHAKWKSEDRRIVEGLPKAGLPEGPPRMGGGYTNVIAIPVDDPDTKAIAGALFKPQGAGPFPAVIYLGFCAGFDEQVERAVQKTWVERLPTKGFATLIVDPYTPRGQANGVCDQADTSGSNAYRYALRAAEDAYAALNALAKLPDINPKRVFLLGYGHAGNLAILATDSHAAANHPLTFAGVVSYWPWCGFGTDFPVPTLVLIGEKDDWSSPGLCTAIKDKPNLEVVVLPGATNSFALPGVSDHLGHHTVYDEKAARDAQARTEAFLAAHMK